MTQPSGPILGAVHLDDGINTRFRWNEESGLASPAVRARGSVQQTFGGPVRVLPSGVIYEPKDLDLPGYLLQVNGLSESYERLARLYQLAGTAGTVSVLQVGALGMQVIPEPPTVERLKAHRVQTDFSMKALGVPGVWTALYGSWLGATYGVVANGESLANTSAFALAAGASPAVTNAGTAAAPLVLTISVSGPRTTRFFIRCTAPGYTKRISVTPTAGGVVSVTEKDGLFVPPGASVLRYEEANGALITGTIASSIYGTRWRYEGLEEPMSEAEPVILYNTRQHRAYAATSAFTTSAGLTLYGPDVPRFGNSGTYDAADAGLVVEPDRTNLVLSSIALTLLPWATTGTITRNYGGVAPDGTSTSTEVILTAGAPGTLYQSVTLTAAPYVISFYARGTGSFTVAMGAILSAQVVTPGANWARYEYLVTGTAAPYDLTFADNATAAAGIQLWGVQVELATGQTAANATSFIPTAGTTQRRYGDIVGVRRLENLLAWSNRFDKTTTTAGERGLWFVNGTPTISSTLQTGPSGVVDATSIAFGVSGEFIEQNFINADNFAGKTVVISLWVKNASATPNSNFTLRFTDGGGGFTEHQIVNLDDQWRRVEVQRAIPATSRNLYFNARATGAITVYIAHAHAFVASEGTYNLASANTAAVSAPYIETQGTPYQAQGTWTWPDWLTQNGYMEADICLSDTANPDNVFRYMLGGYTLAYSPNIEPATLYRSSATGSASNSINYVKTHTTGTPYKTYTPSSSVFDGAYHKWRLEWVNYTIAGTRTFQLRLYLDGALVDTNTITGTSWARPPFLAIVDGASQPAFQTMKNIKIGSPVLPAGAIPEPY